MGNKTGPYRTSRTTRRRARYAKPSCNVLSSSYPCQDQALSVPRFQFINADQIMPFVAGPYVKIRRSTALKVFSPHIAAEACIPQRIVIQPVMDGIRTGLVAVNVEIVRKRPLADPGFIGEVIHRGNELEQRPFGEII